MGAKFTLGRDKQTSNILNIISVDYNDRHEYICPDCGEQLTCVLKDDNVSKHFKHRNENGKCNATFETLLHLTAKEIIVRNSKIKLPNDFYFSYDTALPEAVWGKYRPDVTLKKDDRTLFVEIIVSHPISDDKEHDFFNKSADCLVIDLARYEREFDISILEKDIIESIERKFILPTYFRPEKKETDNNFWRGLAIIGVTFFLFNKIFKKSSANRRYKY